MSCDIRIAADHRTFGLPETNLVRPARRRRHPTPGAPRRCGPGHRPDPDRPHVPAQEALAAGLVTPVAGPATCWTPPARSPRRSSPRGRSRSGSRSWSCAPGWTPTAVRGWWSSSSPSRCSTPPTTSVEGAEAFLAKRAPLLERTMSRIETVLVVGAGAMGSQIAMVGALAGCEVTLYDLDAAVLDRAITSCRDGWPRRSPKAGGPPMKSRPRSVGWLPPPSSTRSRRRRPGHRGRRREAAGQARLLRRQVDLIAPEHTILASNSSSFVPSAMADATARPDRFLNLHFFNPALVMKCVEVVRGPHTVATPPSRPALGVRRADRQDRRRARPGDPGVHRQPAPRRSAGRGDPPPRGRVRGCRRPIDTAARTALGYPMGPFELMDLTGIDIGYRTKPARLRGDRRPGRRALGRTVTAPGRGTATSAARPAAASTPTTTPAEAPAPPT